MQTEIINLTGNEVDLREKLTDAAEVIRGGGLVVFPTETVYGLGADATSADAAAKIYEAKGRPSDNPLIIHIAKPSDAEKYAFTSPDYYKLAKEFMPGPLTVIMPVKNSIPRTTTGGLDTVAVRCPSNKIARTLIELAGLPIAAPSANLSGTPSPTSVSHVIDDMYGRCDIIIDGGDASFGLESTIVKIEGNNSLTLLRPGKVTPEELISLGFELNISEAVLAALKEGERVESPGMKYKHYAPKAPLVLLDGDPKKQIEYIKNNHEKNSALIIYEEYLCEAEKEIKDIKLYNFGLSTDKREQAKLLFSLLRETDKHEFSKIYAPLPEKSGIGLALYNRMIRAAAYKIIKM